MLGALETGFSHQESYCDFACATLKASAPPPPRAPVQLMFENVSAAFLEAMKEKTLFGGDVQRRGSAAAGAPGGAGAPGEQAPVPAWVRLQATE